MYDVVIVGAGPAGSTAAIVARRLGLKALVVDRFKPPREKPCGGGLTPRTWKMLERMGVEYPWYDECGEVRVKVADIRYLHRGEPIRITRRPEFDKALLDQSGADFVADRILEVKGASAVGERGVYEGRVLIGADGANSVVAKALGLEPPSPKTHGIAYMSIAEGSGDACVIDFDFVHEETGGVGYAWAFPAGKYGVDIGLGIGWGPWRDLRRPLQRWAESLGLKPGRILGHPLSLGVVETLGAGEVLLAGEAARLVDASTGEGIYYAVATGALAAQAAYIALKVLSRPRAAAEIYGGLARPFVEEVKRSRLMSQLLARFGYNKRFAKWAGKYLLDLYRRLYVGEATYGRLPLRAERR
ncbi:MAG: geranylgeranyl reductase family protein [Thermoproteus sp. AZ2]|uniref:Geranylgeranyl reductase family protein n=1 Tax=Thermoproteus sp. AZ2 TaxID=1609232 RepID=A0ACC6V1I9_9CREN